MGRTYDEYKDWQAKYERENVVRKTFKFNKNTDKVILDKLDEIKESGGSQLGFVKQCILEHIERENG